LAYLSSDCFKQLLDSDVRLGDHAPVDVRERILDAAEREFAEHGFHGASLRSITRAADVNVASIHYYYGSKQALLRATLERIVQPVNEERLRQLDAVLAGEAVPSVESILTAFIRPDLELIAGLGERGTIMARFSGRSYTEPEEVVSQVITDLFSGVGARFLAALSLAIPEVPMEELRWRLRCVVAIITYLLAAQGTARALFDPNDVPATSERFVSFAAAGMRAPLLLPPRVEIP
jgi:AcrR family transcriptional regulator